MKHLARMRAHHRGWSSSLRVSSSGCLRIGRRHLTTHALGPTKLLQRNWSVLVHSLVPRCDQVCDHVTSVPTQYSATAIPSSLRSGNAGGARMFWKDLRVTGAGGHPQVAARSTLPATQDRICGLPPSSVHRGP